MLTRGSTTTALTVLNRNARNRGVSGERWLQLLFQDDLTANVGPALQVAVESGDPIGKVLAPFVESNASPATTLWLAEQVENRPHVDAVALLELRLATARRLIELLRSNLVEPTSGDSREALIARWTVQVGSLCSRLDDHEEGLRYVGRGLEELERLEPIEEAIAIRQRLAEELPLVFEPALAKSRYKLGVILLQLGRNEEAAAQAMKAVHLLIPHFYQRPLPLAHPMAVIGRQAKVTIERAGLPMPTELAELVHLLDRLEAEEQDEEAV